MVLGGEINKMDEIEIKQKILYHLNGLNNLERRTSSQNLIRILSERYNVSDIIVEQVIAEWSAGKI